jgi:hypothetical protein
MILFGRPGELSEFFVPGLNEPLRTPIGRRSSDEPNAAPAVREAKYKIPAFPDIPVSTFAKEAPAQTPVFQTDNASTIGGIGKFIGDRLMATGEAPSSTRVGLPSRMVSSSFPELTPGNPRQPSSPQQSAPLLGIFSNKPMSPSPLPASLWGLPDNCEASDEGNWFTRLGGAGPENPNQPTATPAGRVATRDLLLETGAALLGSSAAAEHRDRMTRR